MRALYLVLAVLGAVFPVVLGVMFLQRHGLDGGELFRQVFASNAGTLTFIDLAISSLAFWVWLAGEGRRLGIVRWPFVVANVFVGLCFALPLFLYVRSGRLAASS